MKTSYVILSMLLTAACSAHPGATTNSHVASDGAEQSSISIKRETLLGLLKKLKDGYMISLPGGVHFGDLRYGQTVEADLAKHRESLVLLRGSFEQVHVTSEDPASESEVGLDKDLTVFNVESIEPLKLPLMVNVTGTAYRVAGEDGDRFIISQGEISYPIEVNESIAREQWGLASEQEASASAEVQLTSSNVTGPGVVLLHKSIMATKPYKKSQNTK